MNIQTLSIDLLRLPDKNVRVHSQKQMDEYKRSIIKFGQTKPIICDDSYTILAGCGLYEALKACGKTEAWCNVLTGLSAADKKKLMLADNKVYELGITDHNAIDDILKELDGDFDIPGYDDSMLEMLTMSFRETDDFIESYGSFDAEDVKKLNSKDNAEMPPPMSSQSPADAGKVTPGQTESNAGAALQQPQSGRFIVCPHCGKQICL